MSSPNPIPFDYSQFVPDFGTVVSAIGSVGFVIIGVTLAIQAFNIIKSLIGRLSDDDYDDDYDYSEDNEDFWYGFEEGRESVFEEEHERARWEDSDEH